MELDEKDRKIIREVMKNPKITDSELADKIDLSRSGAAKRRKKLEDNDEIQYYASPNLNKIPGKTATGIVGLNPKLGVSEAKRIAKKFSDREEIVGCQVRLAGQNQWGIRFMAISEQLKSKEGTHKMREKWKKEISKEAKGIERVDISNTTYFLKMFGQEIQLKEDENKN